MINRNNWRAYLNLAIVYVVWGSTFLAIRISVKEGSGFPPFTMAFSRVMTSFLILFIIAIIQKKKLLAPKRDMILIFVSGIFLWTGGNGFLVLGELNANSGLAALIVGTLPLWMQILESIVDRKLPTIKNVISLILGFLGITFLVFPTLQQGGSSDVLSIIALLLSPLVWAIGSLIMARNEIRLSTTVISAYQMFSGGIGFYILIKLTGEPSATPIREAWIAWGYLVVFGAVIAYTAYVSVLKQLPMRIVTTYAYVNPVIAVVLGWLILGETITTNFVIGSILIIVGVAGVFRERYKLIP